MPAVDALIPALTSAGALSASVFVALRHNRDDATAIVNQHKEVLAGMRDLNTELEDALNRARARATDAETRVAQLEAELALIRRGVPS